MTHLLIGVCGRNASGKTTVSENLVKRGFRLLSLSDVIRDQLRHDKLDITRENLIMMGNQLRNAHGPGILAQRTLAKLTSQHNYVIDSIRHPAEVDALAAGPFKFHLVAVECPAEVRFARLKSRNRAGDVQTLEEFRRVEELENHNLDPKGQQLDAVMKKAHITIHSDCSMEEFERKVQHVLDSLQKSH